MTHALQELRDRVQFEDDGPLVIARLMNTDLTYVVVELGRYDMTRSDGFVCDLDEYAAHHPYRVAVDWLNAVNALAAEYLNRGA